MRYHYDATNFESRSGQMANFHAEPDQIMYHLADILTHEITFYQGYLVCLFVFFFFSKNNEYFVETLLTIGIHILCLYVCIPR